MAKSGTIMRLEKLQKMLARLPKVAKDHIREKMGEAADEKALPERGFEVQPNVT